MKAVIVAYARTPFHFARKGALAATRPEDLLATAIRGVLTKAPVPHEAIEDVIAGCAYPEGPQGNNIARIAASMAGLPNTVSAMTVNRFCGSSMTAVHLAAAQIDAGIGQAYVCAGVESMTMVPQGGLTFDPHPGLVSAGTDLYMPMGQTAENVAERWAVSRADQEALALASHHKAAAARANGLLRDEIVPVTTPTGEVVSEDGCIRPQTTLEALASLKPAFRPDGVVTAGVDPDVMGIGPVPATRKALARAGLTATDLDVVEINEAFSSQALACIRELGLRPETVNLDGGGLAIGHPLGATGARITGKAAALLQRTKGRYALATQCIGGGQGVATVLENLA